MDTNEIKPIYQALANLAEALEVRVPSLIYALSNDEYFITGFEANALRSYHAARDEDRGQVKYSCPTCGHVVDGPTFLAATNRSFTA